MTANKNEIINSAILVLCVGALMAGAFAVLSPFIPALVWAAIVVVATWPLLLRLERFCRGRRRLAIALLSFGLLLVIVLPVTLLLSTLINWAPRLRDLVTQWLAGPLPMPPEWLGRLPFGDRMVLAWQQAIAQSPDSWVAQIRPYALQSAQWVGTHIGALGSFALQFVLALVLIVLMYVHGDALAALVRRVAHRVGGARGEDSVVMASEAMSAIAAGVVLTALVLAILSGLGLWIAGVPGAGVLMSIVFVLCIVQLGPLFVLVPAIVWLFWRGDTAWGVALAVWAMSLSAGDGFLRAWLIQRGARLPFLLILGGVIGGLLAFGVAGIFIGPILLAVALQLLNSWAAAD